MASFVAYIPRPGVSLTPELLSWELIERGLKCSVDSDQDGHWILFEEGADIVYPSIKRGEIDYLEHDPRALSGRISDALAAIGFEWINEDDPRWRAAE
jgi:hypothetical protein